MNKKVSFSQPWPKTFRDAVQRAGYERTIGCSLDCTHTCIWIKR
jgi:hypothetical protein